ncbi:hypothetical protein LCGC14_0395130 [marine sediment metagenome]|uniref:Capsid protein n=1 Tax=marine sediment metagenome TaxID=412755 RepID=A0A0F9W7D6_9ZZZZ
MAFLGMRGTGDWVTDQVPESWEEFIMREYPNGSAPLYAMQSMFREENVDSVDYHWWTKTLPTKAGDITNVYIDSGLATPYVYASHQSTYGIATAIVYVKLAAALVVEFKDTHLVLLRDSDQLLVDVRGEVKDVVVDGANSYIAVKLIEDDDNHGTSSSYNLATVDRVLIYSSAVPQGSVPPAAVAYDPTKYDGLVQEFRDVLDLTDIARATHLRTGDAYDEAKLELLDTHSQDIENTAFWGKAYDTSGDNGKRLTMTGGIFNFVADNAPANVLDYLTDTGSDYAGKTWLQAGKKWLNTYFMQLGRYGENEVICFTGDAALLGINDLAEAYGDIQLKVSQQDYGIKVTTWIIPGLTVHFKTHPLFSHETTNQNTMVLLHPKNVKFSPLVGGGLNLRTSFETDMQIPGQHSKVDGFYTVGGWKFYFPNQFMVMRNVGKDNTA